MRFETLRAIATAATIEIVLARPVHNRMSRHAELLGRRMDALPGALENWAQLPEFWDKSRSSGCVGIISAQGISSFYAAIGEHDLAAALLQNPRQTICFRTETTHDQPLSRVCGRRPEKQEQVLPSPTKRLWSAASTTLDFEQRPSSCHPHSLFTVEPCRRLPCEARDREHRRDRGRPGSHDRLRTARTTRMADRTRCTNRRHRARKEPRGAARS